MAVVLAVSAVEISSGFVVSAALPAVVFTSTSFAKVVVCWLNSHCRLLFLLHVFVESLPDHTLLVEKLDLAQFEPV